MKSSKDLKCKFSKCMKKQTPFEILKEKAVTPEECSMGDLRKLFDYFHYLAPNIEATQSPILDKLYHETVLSDMLKGNENFCFRTDRCDYDSKLKKLALDRTAVCSGCKRFLCKRGEKSKREPIREETDLECLLRHIRNAVAHGRIYVVHGGNFIGTMFEDIDRGGRSSARIVCNQADLRRWKTIVEAALKDQRERSNL